MTEKTNIKSYFLNLVSSFGGTAISIIIGFISIPISLNYWQTEKYGLWALIISVSVYLSLSNLGLNAAATILMTKNPNVASKLKILKKTFNILIISVIVFFIAFLLLNVYSKNWIMFLGKIPENSKNETFSTCLILGVFFFINLPFSLISSGFQAFQKIYIENVFAIFLTVFNFFNLLLVIFLKGNLVTYAIIYGTGTLLFNIIKASYFYFYIYKKVKKENKVLNKQDFESYETSYKNIFNTGIRYFLIVTASMIVVNTDYLVISNFLGVEKVTSYSVTLKFYQLINSLILLTTSSLLPIMAKELGNNNWNWINNVYERMLIIMSFVGGLIWIGGVLFIKDIIFLWTGKIGYAGIITVFFLGGYSYLLSMVNLNAGIMTSFNYLKPIYGWFEAGLKLGLSILLLRYFDVGGVALGTFLGSLLTGTWLGPLLIVKLSNKRIHYNLSVVVKQFFFIILPLLFISVLVQLFVTLFVLRLAIGGLIIIIYCFLSYNNMAQEIKTLFISKLIQIKSLRELVKLPL
jgi:O-antigen/teichoic acid export membrane protein